MDGTAVAHPSWRGLGPTRHSLAECQEPLSGRKAVISAGDRGGTGGCWGSMTGLWSARQAARLRGCSCSCSCTPAPLPGPYRPPRTLPGGVPQVPRVSRGSHGGGKPHPGSPALWWDLRSGCSPSRSQVIEPPPGLRAEGKKWEKKKEGRKKEEERRKKRKKEKRKKKRERKR